MKFEQISLFLIIFLLSAVASGAAVKQQRTILFGVNYLPHVTCVEEFEPYWKTDNWTEERMVTDLKIMKSIGCSCVRYHIFPALPTKMNSHGVPGEKFIRMLDLGVKTAGELGMLVHLDIADGVDEHGVEGVKFYVNRYKGRIASYQIGNERYDFPDNKKKLEWLQGLVELIHSIDPKAKVSADILVPDWVKIRDQMPALYKGLDVGLAHYYPMTDYRGWNDLYISDLVDYLSNPTGRESTAMKTYESKKKLKDFGEYDAKSLSFDHPWYAGSWGWLDKEVWVTEISSHGYWRWGNLTPENKRAADWQKVVDAIAGAKNRVTRIYHHCFRDKMNSREFGMGQSGIVYYDGSPRPATLAFRKMAVKYSPAKSPLRILSCDIKRSAVNPNSNIANVTITLANKTAKPIRGEAVLELPKGASADAAKLNFSIPPMKSETWIAKIDAANMKWGNNHVFAKVKIPQGLAYGWGIIAKPKRLELNPAPGNTSEGVRYAQGIEAVQEFFDKYGDDCAIITGPCLGDDAEMGYRLKIVMQSMRCGEIPVRPSILAAEVLNRPIIVIGTSEYNLISKTIEMALPEDQKITMANPGKGRGIISVIKQPFGEAQEEGRFSRQSTQIGYYFGSCPAALYIAGTDDAGTRAAVYDLIRRIWGNDNKY